MRIPLCASADAQPEGMVFREANVIRTSFVQKGEHTGWVSVPRVRRNQIERGLQLWPNQAWWLSSIKGCLRGLGPVSSDKSGPVLLLVTSSHAFGRIQTLKHSLGLTRNRRPRNREFNAFAERSARLCPRTDSLRTTLDSV